MVLEWNLGPVGDPDTAFSLCARYSFMWLEHRWQLLHVCVWAVLIHLYMAAASLLTVRRGNEQLCVSAGYMCVQ